jgi:hypothetical protein
MKVLVSTRLTQGHRDNDFCFVREGELVYFGSECSGEKADGRCGCKRSLVGVKCLKATTTMKVVDADLDENDLAAAIHRAWIKGGWFQRLDDRRIRGHAVSMARKLIRIAGAHRVGTILERRASLFQPRSAAQRLSSVAKVTRR